MRLLTIDTAAEACSVGVIADRGRPPVLQTRLVGRGHAEQLMGMIDAVMADAGLALADLDRIAVTVGPGSFTGLRIGIAAARGLALVVGCPAIGIGTLAVHAEAARTIAGARPVLALLDARRDELYGQVFAAGGGERGPPRVGPATLFAGEVDSETLLAGSGAETVAALLGAGGDERVVHRMASPDISALCRLGLVAAEPSAAPRPLYLRAPDAKPQPGIVRQ
jgi:tRNA threonylcarbamoyl adenosine modification protein YeaZ